MTAAKKLKLFAPEKQVKTLKFTIRHEKFLLTLAKFGDKGLTDFELAGKLNSGQPNACMRRVELMQLGYVEDTRTTRKAPSGRNVTVWRVTTQGKIKALSLKWGRK